MFFITIFAIHPSFIKRKENEYQSHDQKLCFSARSNLWKRAKPYLFLFNINTQFIHEFTIYILKINIQNIRSIDPLIYFLNSEIIIGTIIFLSYRS